MAADENRTDWKSAAISVAEGKPAVVVCGSYLLSVEHVQVTHPDRQEDYCPIYGQIYVSNHPTASDPHTTLYNRSREDPETLDLGDDFLSLSYDYSAAQPVQVQAGFPIFLTMKLFEKKATADEDTLIADLEDWEFDDIFDYDVGKRLLLHLEGESGFSFILAYAILNPAILTEVQFKINKDICDDTTVSEKDICNDTTVSEANKKRKRVHIYGSIHACQIIEKDDMPALRLYSRRIDEADQVDIGSLIDLDRKAIVLPVASAGAFTIQYAFHCPDTEQLIAKGRVPFYIKPLKCLDFIANKSLKHTKDVDNGRFSITIKFIPLNPPIPLELY